MLGEMLEEAVDARLGCWACRVGDGGIKAVLADIDADFEVSGSGLHGEVCLVEAPRLRASVLCSSANRGLCSGNYSNQAGKAGE